MATSAPINLIANANRLQAPTGPKPHRYLDQKWGYIERALPVALRYQAAVIEGKEKAESLRFEACRLVMEYAWGKPKQVEEITGIIGIVTAEHYLAMEQQAQVELAEFRAKLIEGNYKIVEAGPNSEVNTPPLQGDTPALELKDTVKAEATEAGASTEVTAEQEPNEVGGPHLWELP